MAFIPLTQEEEKLLVQFRERISDLEFDEIENHDIRIVAWIRAREHDLDKAEEMLRNSIAFFASKNYNTILSWDPPKHYDTCFPFEISGHDMNGYFVIIIPIIKWDMYARKELAAGRKEVLNKWILQLTAKIMKDVKERSNPSENIILSKYNLIIDLQGLKLHHLTSPAIKELMFPNFRLLERNFPETLNLAFVINAPRIFAIIFPLIKSVLAAKTLKRVQVHDHNSERWKAQILKIVSPEEIPMFYGGQLPDTLQKKIEILKNMESDDTIGVGGISTESLTEVTIKAGDKLTLEFDIKTAKSTINWIFKTTGYDIGFSLMYGNENVLPPKRLHSQEHVQEGSYICDNLGKYTVIFDNTFSMFRSKTIYYLIAVENGGDQNENTPNGYTIN